MAVTWRAFVFVAFLVCLHASMKADIKAKQLIRSTEQTLCENKPLSETKLIAENKELAPRRFPN